MNVSSNVSSIQSQQSMLNRSAETISNSAFNPKTDLAQEMTKQIIAQNSTEVNASAIKTADQMLGSLLDMKA